MALIGTKKTLTALHDSTPIPQNDGFYVDADGSMEVMFRNDTVADTFPVLKGVVYGFDIKIAKATGAVGVTELWVVRAEPRG